MNQGKLLVTGPRILRDFDMVRPGLEELGFDIKTVEVRQCLSEDELIPLVGDIDAVICGGDKWTARVMDNAPKLKAICKWGTGTDAIDFDAARERGILVRNVPDAFSVPVADSVMCFILNFARRTPWLDKEIKAGRWTPLDGRSLSECSLGVVGVGNIGSTVLRRAKAFGMKLIATDPRTDIPLQLIDDTNLELTDLDDLLERSDFVSLNCDLNESTRGLIGKRELGLMQESAVLINTSRGPVVQQTAIEDALVNGNIAGAGLDVFETEPLSAESPLLKLDNVMLTPHLAQSSDRAAHRTHKRVVQNVVDLLSMHEGRG